MIGVKKYALKEFYNWKRLLRLAWTAGGVRNWYEVKFYWGKLKKNLLAPKFGQYLKRAKLQERKFADAQLRPDAPATTLDETNTPEPVIALGQQAAYTRATPKEVASTLQAKPQDGESRRWFVNRWL